MRQSSQVTNSRMYQVNMQAVKAFNEFINQQLNANNVPPDKIKPIQESINELIKESEGIKPDQQVGVIKRSLLEIKVYQCCKTCFEGTT